MIFPKTETKLIIGLISMVETVSSLTMVIAFSVRWLPHLFSLYFSIIWGQLFPFLEPIVELREYPYVCYSLHRYAIFAERDSSLQRFQNVKSMMGAFFVAVFHVYRSNHLVQATVCSMISSGLYDCLWQSKILPVTNFLVRLTSYSLLATLQLYVVRTTSKKMAETRCFLLSLGMNKAIENRLIAIQKINRFNKRITILFVLAPAIKLLRDGGLHVWSIFVIIPISG